MNEPHRRICPKERQKGNEMTDLNLKELDRLERRVRQARVNPFNTLSGFCLLSPDQLRPLLDLVEKMGTALKDLKLNCHSHPRCEEALADYRRAQGEKPCEKCGGTGDRLVAGEPVASEFCGECSGEGVVSA